MAKSNVERENNTVTFEFSVTPEEFEKALERSYKKNVKKINLPGFRRGKAPRFLIEKTYGKEIFYEDAVNFIPLPSPGSTSRMTASTRRRILFSPPRSLSSPSSSLTATRA